MLLQPLCWLKHPNVVLLIFFQTGGLHCCVCTVVVFKQEVIVHMCYEHVYNYFRIVVNLIALLWSCVGFNRMNIIAVWVSQSVVAARSKLQNFDDKYVGREGRVLCVWPATKVIKMNGCKRVLGRRSCTAN